MLLSHPKPRKNIPASTGSKCPHTFVYLCIWRKTLVILLNSCMTCNQKLSKSDGYLVHFAFLGCKSGCLHLSSFSASESFPSLFLPSPSCCLTFHHCWLHLATWLSPTCWCICLPALLVTCSFSSVSFPSFIFASALFYTVFRASSLFACWFILTYVFVCDPLILHIFYLRP